MEMRIVDTKGQLCPKPIIETKKVLKEISIGDTFTVITDNETSFNNLKKFLSDNNAKFKINYEEGVWSLEVTKLSVEVKSKPEEEYCSPVLSGLVNGDYVIAITSEYMGQGDEDLGRKLMKSFISIILYLDQLPSSIIFYNSGVKLTVKDSPVAEFLLELEKHKVEIIVCGTCVDFYGIGQQLGTGTINDMLTITNRLLKAEKVIRP
jgi:selenium metabolism protein YedF